jgi:glucan phosphorylase
MPTKTEYKAKIEAFCNGSNYAQAKIVYDQVNKLWSDASKALNDFVAEQGPQARHPNGLTADYVRAMPEYKRLSSNAFHAGEQAKTFNGVFTRVFKKEHCASIQAARADRAKNHAERWQALCASV